MNDTKNLLLTLVLSITIMMGWKYFYEKPRLERQQAQAEFDMKQAEILKQKQIAEGKAVNNEALALPREQVIARDQRIAIHTPRLSGSIALKGARFDDVVLSEYKETLEKNSPDVVLLSPSGSRDVYFAELGWVPAANTMAVPNSNTVWTADKNELHVNDPVTLSWDNHQGQIFRQVITLDDQYMFTIKQEVDNKSAAAVNLLPYGLVSRVWEPLHKPFSILHEGPSGVFNGILSEVNYTALKSDGKSEFPSVTNGGWLGITDKYWLTAIIPDSSLTYSAEYKYSLTNDRDRYQAGYLAQKETIDAGKSFAVTTHLFAGAKQVDLLDYYRDTLHVPLFDRAIDFGWFYYITKPLFQFLQLIYSHVGNFGIAILVITVFIKIVLFPLANKTYRSMNKTKMLQPEMLRLREKFGDDKAGLNKAMMELYKKENVNPMAGCAPMVLQGVISFCLYKVLFVTIEMRHAPFFGWIHDLSAPDPTSILNLGGVIPYTLPEYLHYGIWPVLMGFTMYLQQLMNPAPADPMQAKMMKFMPVLFVFMFHNFPAGLIIYWAWNNSLTVIQQWVIMKTSPAPAVALK